ncbi:MAG: GFA family protein [Hyphomonadaceae bacterium JAD_PAG50586_4]|nr:MAG: GFA family protein [Hyphomonadaceae bacterium JAD_PAG50586_4]
MPRLRAHFGGARFAGFTAPVDKTKITGTTKSYTISADSGALTHRHFCGVCGAYLYGAPDLVDGMINFSIGSLDDPNQAAPSLAVYTRSRANWDVTSEKIACFAELPPGA